MVLPGLDLGFDASRYHWKVRPPHLDRILKLLLLGGRGNPNEHERAVARDKADTLMARHGVTLEQMRDLYRQEMGLPAKARPGARPRARRPARTYQPMTPEEIFQLLKDEFEKEKRARERQAPPGVPT